MPGKKYWTKQSYFLNGTYILVRQITKYRPKVQRDSFNHLSATKYLFSIPLQPFLKWSCLPSTGEEALHAHSSSWQSWQLPPWNTIISWLLRHLKGHPSSASAGGSFSTRSLHSAGLLLNSALLSSRIFSRPVALKTICKLPTMKFVSPAHVDPVSIRISKKKITSRH